MSKYVGFRLGKVHESHVISEYYCGGCGYPVTDHDSFCPECGGAFRECDASNLEAENERLKAENAKLRGLIADLLPFACIGMEDACPTSGCFLFEECRYSTSPDCDVEERMLERLREAGIDMYGEPL